MADDKTDRGLADRDRINIHEGYEVAYRSHKIGCTPAELKAAVNDVGVIVRNVQQELIRARKR